MFNVIGNTETAKKLICTCGNTESFHLEWLGDLSQKFSQGDEPDDRDYDSHSNEGETVNIDHVITCGECGATVAERDLTIVVGDWQFAVPLEKTFLVVVREEYVRDTQISSSADVEIESDKLGEWNNTSGQHVLGTFTGVNEAEASTKAAAKCNLQVEMLQAYVLAGAPA